MEMILKDHFPSSSFASAILGGEKRCFKMTGGSRLWWSFDQGDKDESERFTSGNAAEFLVLCVHTVLPSQTVFALCDFSYLHISPTSKGQLPKVSHKENLHDCCEGVLLSLHLDHMYPLLGNGCSDKVHELSTIVSDHLIGQ